MRNTRISGKRFGENQNIRFKLNIVLPENRAVFEVMWKNVLDRGRPQMTVYNMAHKLWDIQAG
jgi:hypothetical protein